MSSYPFDSLNPRRPFFLPPHHLFGRPPYPDDPNVSRNCYRYVPYASHSSMGHPHHFPPHPPEMHSFGRAPVPMPPPYCRPYESNYAFVNLTHRCDDGPLRGQPRVMDTPNFRHFNGAPCTPHVPSGGIVFCSPQNWNPRFNSPDPCRLPFGNHIPNATSDRDVLSGHSGPYPLRTVVQIGESRRDSKERCWRHPEDYKENTSWERRTYLLKDEANCSEFADHGKTSGLPFCVTSHDFESDEDEACNVPGVRKTENQLPSSARVDSLEGSHQLVRAVKKSTIPENRNRESSEVKAGGGYKSRGTSKIENQLVSTARVDSSSGETYKLIRDRKKSTVIKNRSHEFSEIKGGGGHGSKFVDRGKKYLSSSSDQESHLSEVDDCDGHKSRGSPKIGNQLLSNARVNSSPGKSHKLIRNRKSPTVTEGGSHGCNEAARGTGHASKFPEHGKGSVSTSSYRESHILGSNDSEGCKIRGISKIGSQSLCSGGIDSSPVESHRSVTDRRNSTIIEDRCHKVSDVNDGGDASKFLDDGEKPTSTSFYKESRGISKTGNQLPSSTRAGSSPGQSHNESSKVDEHTQLSSKRMLRAEKAVKFKIKSGIGKGRNSIIHRKNSQGKSESGSLKRFFPGICLATPEIKSSEANACGSLESNELEGDESNAVDLDACFKSNDFVVNPVTDQSCSPPLFDRNVSVTDGKTQISTKDSENSFSVINSQRKGDVAGSVADSADVADYCVSDEQQNSASHACSPIPSASLKGSTLLEGSEVPGTFSFDAVANGIESDKNLGECGTFTHHSTPSLQCEEITHLPSTEKTPNFSSAAALALVDHADYVSDKKSPDEGTFTEGGISDSSDAECGEVSALSTSGSLKTGGPPLNKGALGCYLPELSNPSKSDSLLNAANSNTECAEKIEIRLPQHHENFHLGNGSVSKLSGVASKKCNISEGSPCVPLELHVSKHCVDVPLSDSGLAFGKTGISLLHTEIPSSETCCIDVEASAKNVVSAEPENAYADDPISNGLAPEEENMKRSSQEEGSDCCTSLECENSEMHKKCIKCRAVIVSDTASMVCSECSVLSRDSSTVEDTDSHVSMRMVTVDEGNSPATLPQMGGYMDTSSQIMPVRAASSDNQNHVVKNAPLSEFRSSLKAFLNAGSQNIYSASSEKEECRGKETVDMDDSVISFSPASEGKMQFPEDAQNTRKNHVGEMRPSELVGRIITSEKLFKEGISDTFGRGKCGRRLSSVVNAENRDIRRAKKDSGQQSPTIQQSQCKDGNGESLHQSPRAREEIHERLKRAERQNIVDIHSSIHLQSQPKDRNVESSHHSTHEIHGGIKRSRWQKVTDVWAPALPQSSCKDRNEESSCQSSRTREETHNRLQRANRQKSADIQALQSLHKHKNGESFRQSVCLQEESHDRIKSVVKRQKTTGIQSPARPQSPCKDKNGESLQQSTSSREESHDRTKMGEKNDKNEKSLHQSTREKIHDSIQEAIRDVQSPRHGQQRKCENGNGESMQQSTRSREESRYRIRTGQGQRITDTRSPTNAQSQSGDMNGEERREHHLSTRDGQCPSNEKEGKGGVPSAHSPEEPASAAAAVSHNLSGDASKVVRYGPNNDLLTLDDDPATSVPGTVPLRSYGAVTGEDNGSKTARSLPQPVSNIQNRRLSWKKGENELKADHHLMAASAVSRQRILPKSAPQSRTWHRVTTDPANEQILLSSQQQQSLKKSRKLPTTTTATYMRKGNCLVRRTPCMDAASRGCDADRPTEKPKESDAAADPVELENQSAAVKNAVLSEMNNGNRTCTENGRTECLDDHGSTARITYVKRKSYQLVAELSLPIAADKTENTQNSDGYYKRSKHQLIRTAADTETKQGVCSSGMSTNSRLYIKGKEREVSDFSLVWRLGDLHDPKHESMSRRHVLHWKRRRSFDRRASWGNQRLSPRKHKAGGSHLKWDRKSKRGNQEATTATTVAEAERRRRRKRAASDPSPLKYIRMRNGNQLVRASAAAAPLKRWCRILASEKVRWSLRTVRNRSFRKRKYCQFYTRFGKCRKQQDGKCPYIHDSSKVAVCTRFLNGLCTKPDCKLTHQVIPERMQDCSYFLKGLCSNEDCPYRHVNVGKDAPVCDDFLKGYCVDGDECRKKHRYVSLEYQDAGACRLLHPKKNKKKKKKKKNNNNRNTKLHSQPGASNVDSRYFSSTIQSCIPFVQQDHLDEGDILFCKDGNFSDYVALSSS